MVVISVVDRRVVSKWTEMPMPCKACHVRDSRGYRVLRGRDGLPFCLHVDCPGEWGLRESNRLPRECAICRTTKPAAYVTGGTLNGGRSQDGLVPYRHGLNSKCVHLGCLSVAWLRSGLMGDQE